MKKISFVMAFIIANVAMAQSISVSLNAEGLFRRTTTEVEGGYSSRRECRVSHGRWLGHGLCKVESSRSAVSIQKDPNSDDYSIKIQKLLTNGNACQFEAMGRNINKVQIGAVMDQCEVTVGFTNQDTLSIMTAGNCECDGGNLNIDNAIRAVNGRK